MAKQSRKASRYNSPTRKKRSEAIYGTTVGEVDSITVSYDHRTGEFSFGDAMTSVYSEVTYERSKGPKVLSRIPQSHRDISFESGNALIKNYEFVCAVDTNTRTIRDGLVSVTGIIVLRPFVLPTVRELQRGWKLEAPFCLEFLDISEKTENWGWMAAHQILREQGLIGAATRVGMIVDSDLGNLNSYNARKSPVIRGDLLPETVQLIYASSDAGRENIVNRALSTADSASGQCLDAIENGGVPFNTSNGHPPWYRAYRLIRPNVVQAAAPSTTPRGPSDHGIR
ncbi:hypothetical protein A1D31_37805 [Bradyrhizobium liaoningense]|nr:hypothetical protein A1D31_37805 [Bradyrhizobium liaoningense]